MIKYFYHETFSSKSIAYLCKHCILWISSTIENNTVRRGLTITRTPSPNGDPRHCDASMSHVVGNIVMILVIIIFAVYAANYLISLSMPDKVPIVDSTISL